jgi:taurine dioxygenase
MEIRAIDGTFAQEVTGMPLWRTPDPADAKAVREAYQTHGVLVFRRQALDEAELVEFGKMIGTPKLYAETHWLSTHPEVIILSNMRDQDGEFLGGLANKPLTWHSDQSYYATPVTGCFLYAVEIPHDGGRTSWVSLYDAYATLPAALKKTVDDAVGTFSFAARVGENPTKEDNHDREKRLRETPDVKHRLVNTDPATGRKSLFIDPNTVIAIDGMPDDEAADLLDQLLAHATRPGTVYRHEWEPGDLALWDNAVLLHMREGFPADQNRLLKRMIVELPADRHIIPAAVH